MRKRFLRSGLGLLLLILSSQLLAATQIKGMRVWRAPDNTRLVFDLTGPVKASVFTLSAPDRIVIDLSGAQLDGGLNEKPLRNTPITGLRAAQRSPGEVRLVLDTKGALTPKSFTLAPNKEYGNRLVVDLYDQGTDPATSDIPATVTPNLPATPVTPAQPATRLPSSPSGKRDVVVVIDPGHGGEDPGAIGRGRLYEKNVVLAIAKQLQANLNRQKGFRAELTRTSDYFIPLRQRQVIARKKGADLFISIHADSAPSSSAEGVTVFALSQRGATSEAARWLADAENRSDQVGGVSDALDNKDPMLAGVLMDLSMTATVASSLEVGQTILGQVGRATKLLHSRVEQAGFVVLKSPDIPSILVETGFITNANESAKLASPAHQGLLARQIQAGVVQYFQHRPPPGTYLAWQREQRGGKLGIVRGVDQHRVQPGESLSLIARRYDVDLSTLRAANRLKGDRIRSGQVLTIPTHELAASND
ncbi:N-acetylmuramoyl-L-alanine amidase [Pseudomonas sp. EpS/L25]|uniref:N-acetylmuramoyl-L-alanine amidase n=1 Tax=Pseudomonas sp. EpS/L25 TaxID=1749078 RepID=UPI00074453FD|nr:N-acetylmuramoyl-L-alanine amidase [Pseudomonas sp. EpS/L25]KUM38585.1 N-acetylmuramoyl-L-alanine amidase [Pseudomonas sp. EpS/L25]